MSLEYENFFDPAYNDRILSPTLITVLISNFVLTLCFFFDSVTPFAQTNEGIGIQTVTVEFGDETDDDFDDEEEVFEPMNLYSHYPSTDLDNGSRPMLNLFSDTFSTSSGYGSESSPRTSSCYGDKYSTSSSGIYV